jgi:hypothetical protein
VAKWHSVTATTVAVLAYELCRANSPNEPPSEIVATSLTTNSSPYGILIRTETTPKINSRVPDNTM